MFKEEKYKEIPKEDIMYDLDMPKTACVYEFTGSIPRPPVPIWWVRITAPM